MINENLKTIALIKLPNLAHGTPNINQKAVSKNKLNIETKLTKKSNMETHANGLALYARILINAIANTAK